MQIVNSKFKQRHLTHGLKSDLSASEFVHFAVAERKFNTLIQDSFSEKTLIIAMKQNTIIDTNNIK